MRLNFDVNLDFSTLKRIKNIIIISLSVALIVSIVLLAGPSVETQSQPTVHDLDKKNSQLELSKLYAGNQNTLENTPSLYVNSTKDIQAPVTTIERVLDNNKSEVPVGNATITGDYFMMQFSATDNKKVDRFECSQDAGNFESCKSPIIVYRDNSNASEQSKTIEIRAIDNSSNVEGQPAIFLYKFKEQ